MPTILTNLPYDPGSIFVAALIASVGLWWFNLVLKSVRSRPALTRYGLYLFIWLAYFVLVLILIRLSGS